MFCPKCGKSDQAENTFCRNCGTFLPDFDKLKRREISPEEHLKANAALNILTGVVSLTLAILLYVKFLGAADTPVLIYITAGFLTAMFAWQAQVFWRNLKLKKHFISPENSAREKENDEIKAAPTARLLDEADFSRHIPQDFGAFTTNDLKEKVRNSAQTEHQANRTV